jgi:hypothetical protein
VSVGALVVMKQGGPRLRPRASLAVGLLVALLPEVQPHSIIWCAEWGLAFPAVSLIPPMRRELSALWVDYSIIGAIALSLGLP